MTSIRRQLLVSLFCTVIVGGLGAAAVIYMIVEDEFDEIFDYELREVALSFREDSLGSPIAPPVQIVDAGDDLVIQIWNRAGTLVYLSDHLPLPPPRAAPGFSSVSTPGIEWRVFNTPLRAYTIQVGQPMSVRRTLAARAALRTALPILLLTGALGMVIWMIIGRGLRPLQNVAKAVEQRSAAALQPLSEEDLPSEVRPLVTALNNLLARLGHALDVRRTFIADAAHELRTPLTAVQLQIQLAERATTAEERAAAFAQLREGVNRANHLVQQLLTLARHEPELAEPVSVPVELAQLARQAIADHASIAQAKDIDIGIESDEPTWISGDFDALRAMLGNLIDNAIRYTQRGGRVDVGVKTQSRQPELTVTDNGPGIPPEYRERAFDRFSRQEGSGADGSGLGLAIVKNVVLRHHATIALESAKHERGLRVMVRFPAPPA